MKSNLIDRIGNYLVVLQKSAETTKFANDRPAYTKHLAEAAKWISMIYAGKSEGDVKKEILDEQRSYGWGYLQGNEGSAAEKAFYELVKGIK